MTFAEMVKKHDVTLVHIAERFGILYHTVQNWNVGRRACPPYVVSMMDELLTIDEQK